MLTKLIEKIDEFTAKYCVAGDKAKMKEDLLGLIQTAVDHGEGKNQTNIAEIGVKALKSIFGMGRKD